jgi:hypothetical protein
MAATDHPITDPSRLGDRYRLVQRIDARGSLETWQAFDERLDRSVVLRLLAPRARGDSDAVRSLRATRRAAGATPDPAAPRLLDGGEDDTYGPYLVKEANAAQETTQHIPLVSTRGSASDVAAGRSSVLDDPARPERSSLSLSNPPVRRGYGLAALLGVLLLVGLAGVLLVRTLAPSQQPAGTSVTQRAEPTRPLSGAAAGAPTAEPTLVPTLSARVQPPPAAAPAEPTPPSAAPTPRPTLQAAPASASGAPAETAQDHSPVATIQQHYALIDARRYADGYTLMDAHLRSLNTPAEYASWFANKVSIKPIAVDLVSQTGDQAVVRAVVSSTDLIEGKENTSRVAEQFDLHMEDGAWRIERVTRL